MAVLHCKSHLSSLWNCSRKCLIKLKLQTTVLPFSSTDLSSMLLVVDTRQCLVLIITHY